MADTGPENASIDIRKNSRSACMKQTAAYFYACIQQAPLLRHPILNDFCGSLPASRQLNLDMNQITKSSILFSGY